MTLSEYLDPSRFPLTTQAGLSAEQQMLIDAVNYDELCEVEEQEETLSPNEEATALPNCVLRLRLVSQIRNSRKSCGPSSGFDRQPRRREPYVNRGSNIPFLRQAN